MSLDAQVQYRTVQATYNCPVLPFLPLQVPYAVRIRTVLGGDCNSNPPQSTVRYAAVRYGSSKSVTTDFGRNTMLVHTDQ